MNEARVEVLRGGAVESVHRISVAVADAGRLRARAGSPDMRVYARSAVKPMQALPLVEDGVLTSYGWSAPELALVCASHSGEQRHVELAAAMLDRIGVDASALACGAHMPFSEAAARELRERGERAGRLHNNCSGKHAGMIALAAVNGWPLDGYHQADHPVQQRMLRELSRWTDESIESIDVAVDGCGVSTFGIPLQSLAAGFARFATESRNPDRGAAAVVQAMTTHPELVGGTDRLCTELMRRTAGRIFAKVGAEGVYCAGVPGAELGIALKVEDGAKRAAEPALIEVLRLLGLLTDDDMSELERFARPWLLNTRGEKVGMVRARLELEGCHD